MQIRILINNAAHTGAGVRSGGSFIMHDGLIGYNNATSLGGGVHNIFGSFTMHDGSIVNNTAHAGIGVYNRGTFTLENGRISGNIGQFGGGVFNSRAGDGLGNPTFIMNNGEITNNIVSEEGGGVLNLNIFEMYGGLIEHNSVTRAFWNGGGGVLNGATFNMSGGYIRYNTSSRDGGGIWHDWEQLTNISISDTATIASNTASRTFNITAEDEAHLFSLGFSPTVIALFNNNEISYTRGETIPTPTPTPTPGAGADITDSFTCPNFLAYVRERVNRPGPQRIYDTDVIGVERLNPWGRNITSLNGIEHFIALTRIDASGNQLTILDLSSNVNLEQLFVGNNQITSLDVRHLTSLTYLDASNNYLTSLYARGNTSLRTIHVWDNNLTSLDVSGMTSLETLGVFGNNLAYLNASNTGLVELTVIDQQLVSLDLIGSTSITHLNLWLNNLREIDVSGLAALETLHVGANFLTHLDVSELTQLTRLIADNTGAGREDGTSRFGENRIVALDLSNNPLLTELLMGGNSLPELDLSNNPHLEVVNVGNNELSEVSFTNNRNLMWLIASANNLVTIDLSQNSSLEYVDLSNNQLSNVILPANDNSLKFLSLSRNQISSLDVGGLTELLHLNVTGNNFDTVDDVQHWDRIFDVVDEWVGSFTLRHGNTSRHRQAGFRFNPQSIDTRPTPTPTPTITGGVGPPRPPGGSFGNGTIRPDTLPQDQNDRLDTDDTATTEPDDTVLPASDLHDITTPQDAVTAVDNALQDMLAATGQLTEQDLADLATLAEHAIAESASMTVNNVVGGRNVIDVNQPNLQQLYSHANQTRLAIERQIAARGHSFNRELHENVSFLISNYNDIEVYVHTNASAVPVDRVWILTPYYDISFTHSFITANTGTTGLTAAEITAQLEAAARQNELAARLRANPMPDWLPSSGATTPAAPILPPPPPEPEPLVITAASLTNSPRSYNVSFNRAVEETVRLSVPPIAGDTSTQTLQNTATGEIRPSNVNAVTGNLESRVNASGNYTVVQNRQDFGDIQGRSQEMQTAIRTLASQGVISGMAPGQFAPDRPLTRAQVASLVTNLLSIENHNATGPFTDVRRADWFFMPVNSVHRQNLMSGTSRTTFAPNNNIPRDQMIAITARILRREMNYRNPSNPTNYLRQFNDAQNIADWSRTDIALATRENLITRRADGNFAPGQQITRGEAAIILHRLYRRIW